MLRDELVEYLCLVYAFGRALYSVLNKKIRVDGCWECLFIAVHAGNHVRFSHWRCE